MKTAGCTNMCFILATSFLPHTAGAVGPFPATQWSRLWRCFRKLVQRGLAHSRYMLCSKILNNIHCLSTCDIASRSYQQMALVSYFKYRIVGDAFSQRRIATLQVWHIVVESCFPIYGCPQHVSGEVPELRFKFKKHQAVRKRRNRHIHAVITPRRGIYSHPWLGKNYACRSSAVNSQ
jgi:hypothetical protein